MRARGTIVFLIVRLNAINRRHTLEKTKWSNPNDSRPNLLFVTPFSISTLSFYRCECMDGGVYMKEMYPHHELGGTISEHPVLVV